MSVKVKWMFLVDCLVLLMDNVEVDRSEDHLSP